MNFINAASEQEHLNFIVFTTHLKGNNWFKNDKCRIYRLGWGLEFRFGRFCTYILFNLLAALWLIVFRPAKVFYYETLSCLPAWIYGKLYRNFRLFIHYHEYVSPPEREGFSSYVRFLQNKEKELMKKADWISQTNQDRCNLFYHDNPFLDKSRLQQLPNYPPHSWLKFNVTTSVPSSNPLRIVYVGSLGMDTMYIREFADWVVSKKGEVIWDLYSDHYASDIKGFFNKINSDFIRLKPGVKYFDLPQILTRYHVGVVLYKGHIPNYIFNVPNKVVEYLICGLEVWCPEQMKSVYDFKLKHPDVRINMLDFQGNFKLRQPQYSGVYFSNNSALNIPTAEESFNLLLEQMKKV